MDFATFSIQLLNSIQYGLLLFLVASGLSLVFGIMGIINLAHGSFYMLGAYTAYWLTTLTGNFYLAILLGLPLAFCFGALLEWALFSYLYRRDHMEQVLLTFGLILIFEEVRSILVGDDVYGVSVPNLLAGSIPLTDVQSYPIYRLVISLVCVLVVIGLYWLINKTKLGMIIRAGNHNRTMVEALGININIIYRIVFSLGVGLAALAGMMAAPVSSVYPNMGGSVLIISFVIVVIGGIGSIWGALVAALIISFADTFGKVLMPSYSGMIVYFVMALMLLWRPEGLFKKT